MPTMETDFDENVGKINVVAQDVGRVILNLITNAFYAVKAAKSSKRKRLPTNRLGEYQKRKWKNAGLV